MGSQEEAIGCEVDTERFAHFLNPIRDLAKNWEIDIAAYLEEYITELEHVAITFDCGKTVMNFADAALLIQGSACVYSRKVDFLYNLVLQLLDVVRCSKKQRQQKKHDSSNSLNENTSQVENFLTLDNCDVQQNLNFKETDAPSSSSQLLLPCTPCSVIPLDSEERNESYIKTEKNELLGFKTDFSLNSMEVDLRGSVSHDIILSTSDVFGSPPELPVSLIEPEPQPPPPPDPEELDDDFVHDDAFPPEVEPEPPVNDVSINSEKFYNLRKRATTQATTAEKAESFWKLANAHEEVPSKIKPPRKGRTLNVLKTVENVVHRASKRLRKMKPVENAKLPNIAAFCNNSVFSHSSKLPKNSKHLICPSIENLFYEEFQRRKMMLQNLKEQLKRVENDVKEESDEDDDDGVDFRGDDNVNDDLDCDDFQPLLLPNTNDDKIPMSPLRGGDQNATENVSMSYEDLIRKHTESYMASTREFNARNSMSRKVKEWEDSLSTILEEEETHCNYDMRDYCGRVLRKFSSNNRKQTMSFSTIAAGEPAYEVARIFLASLQLANNYNVDIEKTDENLELTLLSRKQHFEDLFTE